MKLLLVSNGISNPSIAKTLIELTIKDRTGTKEELKYSDAAF